MQLSNKAIKNQDLEKELPGLVKQNSLDMIVGSMQVTAGVFLLLFSQRMNKEMSVVITGIHERAEVVGRVEKLLMENYR